jgi:hypothetical protein
MLYKNRGSTLQILIVLCFYSGLASVIGKNVENPYKVLIVISSIYLLLQKNGLSLIKEKEKRMLAGFFLFSVSFLYSAVINEDYFNLVFSQYGKYVTPICVFFILNQIVSKRPEELTIFRKLLFDLLTIQIILSFIKIFTIGLIESTVGSLANIGGGPAALLPVLGFIILWQYKRGRFKWKDWLYVFFLVFIGFASVKRAVWFIVPAIIFLFDYYVGGRINIRRLLYAAMVVPLIFYLGVRLNPTLNKEGKIGGSFDVKYVLSYAQRYSFGKTSETDEFKVGEGRGGAALLLWGKLKNWQDLSFSDFWGVGLRNVYTTSYEQFEEAGYGLNSKGAATGVYQTYLSSGFIGMFITILFIALIIGLIDNFRVRIVIGFLLFWDYFFYSGIVFKTPSLSILLFFIIIYSNIQNSEKKMERFLNRKNYVQERDLSTQTA